MLSVLEGPVSLAGRSPHHAGRRLKAGLAAAFLTAAGMYVWQLTGGLLAPAAGAKYFCHREVFAAILLCIVYFNFRQVLTYSELP